MFHKKADKKTWFIIDNRITGYAEKGQNISTGHDAEIFDNEQDWQARKDELGITEPEFEEPEPKETLEEKLRQEFDQKLEERVNQIAEAVESGARGQELAELMRKR